MKKRREPRYPVTDPLSFQAGASPGEGTIVNLSANGCAFESVHPIDPNAPLALELAIPNEQEPVKVTQARVTWRAGNGMGVEFLTMNQTSKARLEHYLGGLPQPAP